MTQHSVASAYIGCVVLWQHSPGAVTLAVSWGVLERPAPPGPR